MFSMRCVCCKEEGDPAGYVSLLRIPEPGKSGVL